MDMVREIPMPFGTLVFRHPQNKPDEVIARWNVAGRHSYTGQVGGLLEAALRRYRTENGMGDIEMTGSPMPQEVNVEDDIEAMSNKPRAGSGSVPTPGDESLEKDSCAKKDFSGEWWRLENWNEELTEEEDDVLSDEVAGPTIRGTTTTEMPHACGICGRPFRRKKDIRRHLSTHSNEKPFACLECPLTFRSRDYLSRHCKRVHEIPRSVCEYMQQGDGTSDILGQRIKTDHSANDRSGSQDISDDTEADDQEPMFEEDVVDLPVAHATSGSPRPSSSASPAGAGPHPGRPELNTDQCGVCARLIPRNLVMVLLPKSSAADAKPRIVCKPCFAKNTGLLCIG